MAPSAPSQAKIRRKILVCNWRRMRYLQGFHISTGSMRKRKNGRFWPVDIGLRSWNAVVYGFGGRLVSGLAGAVRSWRLRLRRGRHAAKRPARCRTPIRRQARSTAVYDQNKGVDHQVADIVTARGDAFVDRDVRVITNEGQQFLGSIGIGRRQNHGHQWAAALDHGACDLLELPGLLTGNLGRRVAENGQL